MIYVLCLFPIKVCAACSEEFELKPDKPGFANRCPACSEPEKAEPIAKRGVERGESSKEANEARRQAMKNLLYSQGQLKGHWPALLQSGRKSR